MRWPQNLLYEYFIYDVFFVKLFPPLAHSTHTYSPISSSLHAYRVSDSAIVVDNFKATKFEKYQNE